MQSNVLDSPCDKHRAICLAVDINVSMLPLINFKKESRERYLIQLWSPHSRRQPRSAAEEVSTKIGRSIAINFPNISSFFCIYQIINIVYLNNA